MARQYRSRDRWVRILVGLPDQPSRDIAASMAVASNTVSPMTRGVQWNNMGVDGSGVLEDTRLLDYPLQAFYGATSPIRVPRIASGDMLANSAPGTKGDDNLPSYAWMDLGKVAGTRMS